MDELEFSGKRYISSKRAAKENHYHSDYIGQMIRAGKIAGTKVGRAWYVDVESLSSFLGKVPTQNIQKEPVFPIHSAPFQEKTYIVDQAPVLEKRYDGAHSLPGGLTYLEDDEPLLPPLAKSERKIEIRKEELPTVTEFPIPQKAYFQESADTPLVRPKVTRGPLVFAAGMVGILVFFGTVSLSYFLQLDMTVQEASVSSSLHF